MLRKKQTRRVFRHRHWERLAREGVPDAESQSRLAAVLLARPKKIALRESIVAHALPQQRRSNSISRLQPDFVSSMLRTTYCTYESHALPTELGRPFFCDRWAAMGWGKGTKCCGVVCRLVSPGKWLFTSSFTPIGTDSVRRKHFTHLRVALCNCIYLEYDS